MQTIMRMGMKMRMTRVEVRKWRWIWRGRRSVMLVIMLMMMTIMMMIPVDAFNIFVTLLFSYCQPFVNLYCYYYIIGPADYLFSTLPSFPFSLSLSLFSLSHGFPKRFFLFLPLRILSCEWNHYSYSTTLQ